MPSARSSSSLYLSASRALRNTVWLEPIRLTCNFFASYETVVKRWPVILTSIIDNIYRVNHDLSVAQSERAAHEDALAEEKIEEGKGLIEKISKLKYDMGRDRPLECVQVS